VQPAFQTRRGDLGAEGVSRRLGGLVGDQFDALQQATPPDVADASVTRISPSSSSNSSIADAITRARPV